MRAPRDALSAGALPTVLPSALAAASAALPAASAVLAALAAASSILAALAAALALVASTSASRAARSCTDGYRESTMKSLGSSSTLAASHNCASSVIVWNCALGLGAPNWFSDASGQCSRMVRIDDGSKS